VNMMWENKPIVAIGDPIATIENGLILQKDNYDQQLLDNLNEFISKSKQDGTLDSLSNHWFSDTEPTKHPDYNTLTGENGIIKVAVTNSMKPMAYRKGDLFTGYEVDFLTRFAKEYGYKLDFQGMDFDALIPAVVTGKCDLGAASVSITPERKQSVTFTDSHLTTESIAVVYQGIKQDESNTFINSISESFEKTFIRENRWKLIIDGIIITILISLLAIIFGTLLGFGLYMLKRSSVKLIRIIAINIARVYSRIIAGTPVVVILMLLFYVVFSSFSEISGVFVAVICFSLTFGAFVYDHMTVSVNSVDKGQIEAAYALGYTKNKTFFKIIFPQSMSVFLPSYCAQAVELIKATSVVGYIAVNDLTKMGDIIRSNTYEAFFPLISTAVIYFLLTWALSSLLGLVKKHFEPKRRTIKKILKGVKNI
ncbi:MAG: ABC transporter substrate-binding protein/permease, partial [Clostridia bacterium]|nr:ABC transporter substrate-binding protein/permease [Clostridia bacterium]